MKQKSWMKRYGIHAVICTVIIAVAFGINRKINIDRSHVYTLSTGTIVLERLTEFKAESGKYIFKGWGFDPKNYSENTKCELILQDTETGEALWPTMDKNPEKQEIEERYVDGGDYTAGSFAGKITERKVDKDKAYEILLRYTSETKNEAGEAQPYIATVTTNDFLYQGEVTEYNPKTFVAPQIVGTTLEKELEGARLFHYFEEGMWVYIKGGKMYYVLDDEAFPLKRYPNGYMAVNWLSTNHDKIPEDYQQYGGGNADFEFMSCYVPELSFSNYKVAIREIPSQYTTVLYVRFHDRDSASAIFGIRKQLKE
ncbi:hypothetical protein [Acetivibrio ethanolgignens]|uniref:Uncharacterized protein n=1 Tax=Acetivibrio ethanolgignens TaxID=290052 RepID=A0A0V8QA72_9FIRM|nr:hypothetical protein [Acetivibrio ethanolgignens]KSV57487.1 hypothetical protein ASU35_04740 [Acetivibrio ethanolgignens]